MLYWLRRFIGEEIPKTSLGFFCDQCATLLATGLSVERTVERAAQCGDREIAEIATAMRPALAAGAPLSKALIPVAHRLPPIFLPLVEVGDASGTLESSFRRLSNAFHHNSGFDQRYQFQVFNPWLVILVVVLYSMAHGAGGGFAAFLRVAVTGFTELAVLYVAGRWALRLLARWPPFRLAVDTVKLAIPGLGQVARTLAAARWGRSFATLWEAGVPVSSALEVSSRSALNAHYEQALQKAAQATRQGRSLSASLAGVDLLPAHLLTMIEVGEQSGKLGETINRFAGFLEEEGMMAAQRSFMSITVAIQIITTILIALTALTALRS